jgi:hypothetical protein
MTKTESNPPMFQRFSPLLEQKSQAYAKAILAKLVTEIDAKIER